MSKIHKRNCNNCGKYYEGWGKDYCSLLCAHKSGVYSFWKGKKLSEKHRLKVIKTLRSPKKLSEETKKKISETRKRLKLGVGRKHSIEELEKMSKANRGEKGNNWKGGVYPIELRIRDCFLYKQWRKQIFKRDNYTCKICGQIGSQLCADHYIVSFSKIINCLKEWVGIDNLYESSLKFEPLWDINNGRTLCIDCHRKTDNYGAKANGRN